MDLLSVLGAVDLSAVLIFCIIFLITLGWVFKPKSDIPGPTPWPIFGNLYLVEKFNNSKKRDVFIEDLVKKYGPINRLFFGLHQLVLVHGQKNVNEVLLKRGRDFIDRPSWIPLVRRVAKAFGGHNGIIWSNGEEWKNIRRFSLQSMRDFGVGKTSLEEKILEEAQSVAEVFEKANGSAIHNVKDIMTKASCNVIHMIIFGYRYQHDNPELIGLTQTMNEIFAQAGQISATGLYPILNLIFKSSYKRRLQLIKVLKDYIDKEIMEHRESFDENNIRDFIDMYIKAENDRSDSNFIFETILDLFAAGTDTTSTTLDWSLLYMIQHPDVQEKCQQEIKQVIGSSRMVRSSDKPNLPYVEATLLEIMRLSNTALLTLPHCAVCDTTIGKYKVPKDSIVFASLLSCHMDETVWDNPKDFNPDRFLDEDQNIINREYIMAFSLGPRICPGESLARSELFLIFSNLLQRFTFSKVDQNDVLSFDGITGITRAAPPYRLAAKPK